MNPMESQKAMAINHGISLANAEKAPAKVRVPVKMDAPSPMMATAPRGSGLVMIPAMVARKMAKRCQAWLVIPAGWGMNQTATPRPTAMEKVFMSAPQTKGASTRAGAASAAAEAITTFLGVGVGVVCGAKAQKG